MRQGPLILRPDSSLIIGFNSKRLICNLKDKLDTHLDSVSCRRTRRVFKTPYCLSVEVAGQLQYPGNNTPVASEEGNLNSQGSFVTYTKQHVELHVNEDSPPFSLRKCRVFNVSLRPNKAGQRNERGKKYQTYHKLS
jgi:hypothetical protein